ncbi:MAG: hypothetical protein EOO72_02600 [Myxococcaceae bacterium]|nr:MAG: hypothetical protein EOO72_02600 [Myxococcaceae bacterium]
MELIVFAKRRHPKYINDWAPPGCERLRSITTEHDLWERLDRAARDGEEVIVFDPERRLALRSKVKSTAAFDGTLHVVFDWAQQKTCPIPTPDFLQGRIGAEVRGGVVLRYY